MLVVQALGCNYNNYQDESFNQRPLDSSTNCHPSLTGNDITFQLNHLAATRGSILPWQLFAALLSRLLWLAPSHWGSIVFFFFFFLYCIFCLNKHGEHPVQHLICNCSEKQAHVSFDILNCAYYKRQWFMETRLIIIAMPWKWYKSYLSHTRNKAAS